MGQRIIAENAQITDVTYKLPNKHYVPVDMKYIGVDNMSPCVLLRRVCALTMVLTHIRAVRRRRCSCRSPRPGMCPDYASLRRALLMNDV